MGAVLVPYLLERDYVITILDLMIYGKGVLTSHPHLNVVRGDIRDQKLLTEILPGCDAYRRKPFVPYIFKKINEKFGFETKNTIRQTMENIYTALSIGLIPDFLEDEMHFNLKRMQVLDLA